MSEPTEFSGVHDVLELAVAKALMTGIALTKPAWESVPVDPCEPTGEMKNVVSTDVTPLRDHIAAALTPLLNSVRAEALREAAQVMLDGDRGLPFDDDQDVAIPSAWLVEYADRIEQNSEGNEA